MTLTAAKRDVAARLTAFGIFLGLFPFVAMLLTCAVLVAWCEFRDRDNLASLFDELDRRGRA